MKTFTAKDANGKGYRWGFWREEMGGLWMLRDHTGYIRVLENTWNGSVPRIRLILSNYGLTAEVS